MKLTGLRQSGSVQRVTTPSLDSEESFSPLTAVSHSRRTANTYRLQWRRQRLPSGVCALGRSLKGLSPGGCKAKVCL